MVAPSGSRLCKRSKPRGFVWRRCWKLSQATISSTISFITRSLKSLNTWIVVANAALPPSSYSLPIRNKINNINTIRLIPPLG